jgi:hypothetical protein
VILRSVLFKEESHPDQSQEQVMENERRLELKAGIEEALDSCEDGTLLGIAELLRRAEDREDDRPVFFAGGINRRQFLVGAAAAGAALVSTNLATGLVAGSLGNRAGQAVAQLESEAELLKLRGLLALYENLEQVGIDALLSAGVAALSMSLEGLEAGITTLEKGVGLVDAGVSVFERSFSTIRRGLILVEGLFAGLETRVEQLQETMSEVQEFVSPVSDAVGSLLSSLVERIPGVGPATLDALDRISELMGALPDAIGEVRSRLVEPLREEWFTDDEESGLKGRLLNPLQNELLEPLEAFLGDLADAVDEWQGKLIDPAEEALTEREAIRRQISDYKTREGIA